MSDDKTKLGVQKSHQLGENVEAFMDSGLDFLKALETYLKVYEHPPAITENDVRRIVREEQARKLSDERREG